MHAVASDGSMDAQSRSLPRTLGGFKYGSLDEQRTHLNFGRFTRPLVANESWEHWWEWYGRERGTPHLPVEGKLGPKGDTKVSRWLWSRAVRFGNAP